MLNKKETQLINDLLKMNNEIQECFHGHFFVNSKITDNVLYELKILTNFEYYLSLLIDDTWSYFKFKNGDCSTKVVYYLLHPALSRKAKTIIIDDPEILYYVPYTNVKKTFLYLDELDFHTCTSKIEELFKCPPVHLLSLEEKKKPIISVITTVFNNAKLLEQAIQSIINQNNPEVEYIIKDAMSNDNINEVIDRYRQYVDIISSTSDDGIYYGMTQGINLSHGQYLQVLNSDDIQERDCLKFYIDNIRKSNLPLYGASIYYHRCNNVVIKHCNHSLSHKIQTNHMTMVMKKEIFNSLGGFDYAFRCSGDRNLLIRFLKAGYEHIQLDVPIGHFRATGYSSVTTLSVIRENFHNQLIGYKFDLIGYFLLVFKVLRIFLLKMKK